MPRALGGDEDDRVIHAASLYEQLCEFVTLKVNSNHSVANTCVCIPPGRDTDLKAIFLPNAPAVLEGPAAVSAPFMVCHLRFTIHFLSNLSVWI